MRLIDADVLKEAFKAWKTMDDYYHNTDCDDIPFSEAFDLIDNAPTVTLSEIQSLMCEYLAYKEERPRGKWISNPSKFSFMNCGRHCSLCGKVVEFSENFCPDCGAYMRGDDNG